MNMLITSENIENVGKGFEDIKKNQKEIIDVKIQ